MYWKVKNGSSVSKEHCIILIEHLFFFVFTLFKSRQPNKLVVVWTRRKRRKQAKVKIIHTYHREVPAQSCACTVPVNHALSSGPSIGKPHFVYFYSYAFYWQSCHSLWICINLSSVLTYNLFISPHRNLKLIILLLDMNYLHLYIHVPRGFNKIWSNQLVREE